MRVGPALFGIVVFAAAPLLAQTAVDPGGTAPPAAVSLTPASGSDVHPAPPPSVAWGTWLYPARYPGGSPMSGPRTPLFARLTLELPPLLGFRPFVSTVFNTGSLLAPSSDAGLSLAEGPLRLGTRFSLSRDRTNALLLNNGTYARYVERTFDLGVESVQQIALTAERRVTQQTLLLSAGVHPSESAPTVRLSTALPAAGPPRYAGATMFGKF